MDDILLNKGGITVGCRSTSFDASSLIDGKVYQVGSLIDGADPKACWKVETIRKDEVVLRLGKTSKSLKIIRRSDPKPAPDPEIAEEVEK